MALAAISWAKGVVIIGGGMDGICINPTFQTLNIKNYITVFSLKKVFKIGSVKRKKKTKRQHKIHYSLTKTKQM